MTRLAICLQGKHFMNQVAYVKCYFQGKISKIQMSVSSADFAKTIEELNKPGWS